jgi:FG-GAP-like repeat
MRSTLLMLFSAACVSTEATDEPLLTEIDGWSPVAVSVGSGAGVGTAQMPVRLVNTYGAAVPGTQVSLQVEGSGATLEQSTLELDANGYAWAEVSSSVPQVFTLSVTSAADVSSVGTPAQGYILAGSAPTLGLWPSSALDPSVGEASAVAEGTGGAAVASGDTVWWVSTVPGTPPHQVADMAGDVAGMRAAHLDDDGILDLLIWGGTDLIALRGHPSGGYSWAGGWRVDSMDVVQADASDLDGDRFTDVAVLVSSDALGGVQILKGNGSWGFEQTPPLLLDEALNSMAAADESSDGRPDVTVLAASTGYGERYTQTDGWWGGGAPPQLSASGSPYQAPAGSRLLPLVDLDADGTHDVVIQEGIDGSSQDLVFYTLGASTTRYTQAYGVFQSTVADINGDGANDIVALEDGTLHIIRYDLLSTAPGFTASNVTVGIEAGPVAAFDTDGDGTAEVVGASTSLAWFPGEVDKTLAWSAQDFTWRQYDLSLSGPWAVADVDGDGFDDVLGFKDDGTGNAVVSVWRYYINDEGSVQAQAGGSFTLGTGTPRGIVACDGIFFALSGSDDSATLARFEVDENGSTWTPSAVETKAVAGSLLACGTVQNGNVGAAVATLSGTWATYNQSANEVSTGSAGTAAAIAVGDPDGDGTGEVIACADAGCSIVAGDIDGDGSDEFITGGTLISVSGWDSTTTLPGSGEVTLNDLDGDGMLDVLAADETRGTLNLYPGLTGGLGWPMGWHTSREFTGGMRLADVDGDGDQEVILSAGDGTVSHSEQR